MQDATALLVVTFSLSDDETILCHSINQPMFIGDPFRPPPGQLAFQRLRLPDAAKRVSLCLVDNAAFAAICVLTRMALF